MGRIVCIHVGHFLVRARQLTRRLREEHKQTSLVIGAERVLRVVFFLGLQVLRYEGSINRDNDETDTTSAHRATAAP